MIKQIWESDIAACVGVIRESFSTVAQEFGITPENAPRYVAFATTAERLQWHMHGEHRPMYAWFDGERVVGYYSLLPEQNACELNNLCVLPAYRHKGIGEALLQHAFAAAKDLGCETLQIGIVEENQVLRAWYERFGFVHTGTKKFEFFPFTCGYMEKRL